MRRHVGPRLLAFLAWAATSGLLPPGRGTLFAQSQRPRPSPDVPTLAGSWAGDDWGEVILRGDGSGTYASTYGTGPGRLTLRRLDERHFAGRWRESPQRFGTLEILLSPDGATITGTWAPDPQCTIGSRTGGRIAWVRRAPG